MSDERLYETVWPSGRRTAKAGAYARRLDTPESKTIAELWDWAFRGDEIFPMLEKGLRKRYPNVKFVDYRVFGSIHGGGEAKVIASLPAMFKQHKCDAVISATGC